MTTDVGSARSRQALEEGPTPVSARVSPTDRIRAEIDALFDADRNLVDVLEDVARLGARLLIQTAVEAEVAEFLGRALAGGVFAGPVFHGEVHRGRERRSSGLAAPLPG